MTKLCSYRGCGRIVSGQYCKYHAALLYQQKQMKARAQANTSPYWRALRRTVLERDDWQCQSCHTSHNLQVHIDPRLEGDHMAAMVGDCITLCAQCHGRIDGARHSKAAA